MQFSITTEVDAPPEVVFAVLSEVERWPEWTPTVTRVERLGDAGAPLALGAASESCSRRWRPPSGRSQRSNRVEGFGSSAALPAQLSKRITGQSRRERDTAPG